jgi:Plasmid pRiA4b ORF-3-like protein
MPDAQSIYRLKIRLEDLSPEIWRRVEVPADLTLGRLHRVIQVVFGWSDAHLHQFEGAGGSWRRRGTSAPRPRLKDGWLLCEVAPRERSGFWYVYDFGDGWEHNVLVEAELPPEPGVVYPAASRASAPVPPRTAVASPATRTSSTRSATPTGPTPTSCSTGSARTSTPKPSTSTPQTSRWQEPSVVLLARTDRPPVGAAYRADPRRTRGRDAGCPRLSPTSYVPAQFGRRRGPLPKRRRQSKSRSSRPAGTIGLAVSERCGCWATSSPTGRDSADRSPHPAPGRGARDVHR